MSIFKYTFFSCLPLLVNLQGADEIAKSSQEIAAKLYKHYVWTKDSFVVSPITIQTGLAVLQSGITGKIASQQIYNILHLHNSTLIENNFQTLLGILKRTTNNYDLQIINKLYVNSNLSIEQTYINTINDKYGAYAENADLSNKSVFWNITRNWAMEVTGNKLKYLNSDHFADSNISPFMNAIYFSIEWNRMFKRPSKCLFYKRLGDMTEVNMMSGNFSVRFHDSADLEAKILEIPFKGTDNWMGIILPHSLFCNGNCLEDKALSIMSKPLQSANFKVYLPEFEIETNKKMRKVFKKLNVTSIFECGHVNLDKIVRKTGRTPPLYINEFYHHNIFKVNRYGINVVSPNATPPPYLATNGTFIVNHPFMLYFRVRDYVLFIGRAVFA